MLGQMLLRQAKQRYKVHECDTRDDDSKTSAGKQKNN